MGTTHYLSIETDREGQEAITKLWKHIREKDVDAPELRWLTATETLCRCYSLHWRKASYTDQQLARLMSKAGATGRVSLAEWDSDVPADRKHQVSSFHIPRPIWLGFTASLPKNRLSDKPPKDRDP